MNHPLRRKDGVRRIGISPEADAIACLNFVGRGPERFYDSDSLTSQKCWQFNFAPAVVESLADKFVSALLNINEVDARRVVSHQSNARAGNRRGQLLETHYLRTAVRMNTNRFHLSNVPSGNGWKGLMPESRGKSEARTAALLGMPSFASFAAGSLTALRICLTLLKCQAKC